MGTLQSAVEKLKQESDTADLDRQPPPPCSASVATKARLGSERGRFPAICGVSSLMLWC